MNDFAYYYAPIFYTIALLCNLGVVLATHHPDRLPQNYARKKNNTALWVVSIIVALWLGLRPVSWAFGDTGNYAQFYKEAATLVRFPISSDWLFDTLMVKFARAGLSVHWWFLLIEMVYVLCHAKMCEKLFGQQALLAFIVVISAFQFYAFGVNGIRNGMAVALSLPAIYYMGKRSWVALLFAIMAIYTHSSAILIIGALGLTLFVKTIKLYLSVWLLCLGAALVGGDFFENLFLAGGIVDSGHEASYYLNENADMSLFSRMGFRWDFLAYGVLPILWGYYFIVKKGYTDKLFVRLVNIYITCNAFWLLVNQNWLSNRIAYLSWFLYAFILLYPLLRMESLSHRRTWIVATIIGHVGFTYFMFLIGKLS